MNGLELEIPSNEILELEPAIETLGYVNEIKSKNGLHVNLEIFLKQAIKNYQLINSNPHYYLTRIDFFTFSGLMYLGDLKPIALGALLDSGV